MVFHTLEIYQNIESDKSKIFRKCQNGISKGGEYFGNGFPFVSYGDVYKNYSLPQNVDGLIMSTKTEQNIYSVKYGDVFLQEHLRQ